ncbi:YybH family protein [Pelagibacterium halotolerans]|uniref:YybH family protein n=1 Tax=Pelagibacterium halotolerans TaxID=531813 RepID=UPI00384AF3F8
MTPEDLIATYEQRLAQMSFDAVSDLIAPDAFFWFSDGSHRGLEQIRRAFDATWAQLQNETYWLTELEWIARGDTAAACIYKFNWTAQIDGQPASGAGRGTSVLEKREGRWLIVHEHLSADPA